MPFAHGDGYDIYFEVRGEGPPVLCPNGWGIITGDGHVRLPERLREEFTTIVYDHRGLGRSSDIEASATTADYGRDAALVAEAAGFSRMHVYGHGGLGACLSQHLAAQRPDLVDRLVLVSGWAGPDTYKQAQSMVWQRLFDLEGLAAFRQWGALLIYTPEYYNEHEAEILSEAGSWGEFTESIAALRKVQTATIAHHARDVLPLVQSETLVVHGELDVIDPPRLGREIASLIPRALLKVVPAAPHAIRTVPESFRYLGDLVADFFHAAAA
jgi:pimeloyl-ACP methyl ester carboxylesterase